MEKDDGPRFAQLLVGAFDAMVNEVREVLAQAGHPDLSVGNEFAMQAIEGGADSAADLARALGVTRQAAAKTISALERLDYVDRSENNADARRKRLVVTPRGREAITIGARAFDVIYNNWSQRVGTDTATLVASALRDLGAPQNSASSAVPG